jgi:hypothetical protein
MPPPPVSGAVVGNAVDAGADVCAGATLCVGVAVGAAAAVCVAVALCVGAAVAVCVGAAAWVCVAVAVGETGGRDEIDMCGALDAGASADREDPPAGDGVRVPDWVADCPPVEGVGVKMDGTDELPPVQAETVTARRTAPAAERPAMRHAPGSPIGGIRRIFMNPPRMRVR